MSKILINLTAILGVLLVLSETNAKPPKVPKAHVSGKVLIPKKLESFENLTLEIRLYKFNPLIADKGADLVEKKQWMKLNHKKGSQSAIDFDLGQKATLDTRMHYYLTIFLLDGNNRTHIGEIDGKRGLNKVINNGKSKNVKIILRAVR